MPDRKSEHKTQESDSETEVPEEFFIAYRDINSRVDYLVGYFKIKLPSDYSDRRKFLLNKYPNEKSLYEYITRQKNQLEHDHQGINGSNLIYRRDNWLKLVIDALHAATIFAANDFIDKAWFCLNVAAYQMARVQIITGIEISIQANISKARITKSKETLSRQTINEKKLLIDLFGENSPELGWKNIKIAMHQIESHLIKEIKAKKPNDTPQEIERASEELLKKFRNWRRTDTNFKSQIDRYIQNRIVPDLTKLD